LKQEILRIKGLEQEIEKTKNKIGYEKEKNNIELIQMNRQLSILDEQNRQQTILTLSLGHEYIVKAIESLEELKSKYPLTAKSIEPFTLKVANHIYSISVGRIEATITDIRRIDEDKENLQNQIFQLPSPNFEDRKEIK